MKKNKDEGITLIALIITIIILLLLVGITISAITRNNGLVSKTKIVKEETEYTSAKEKVQIEIMAAQTQNYLKENEKLLITITNHMIEIQDISVNKIYFSQTSQIDEELQNQFNKNQNIEGIVVSVNEYSKYKFLIGKEGEIEGATTKDTDSMTQEEFDKIEDFEKDLIKNDTKEEISEELDIKITDINQDGYVVNVINNYPENMDVKYEYYIDNTKVTDKIKDKKYIMNDSFSEHRICVVAYSGDTVLKSKDIIFEAPYKIAPILDSNTDSILHEGFLENYTETFGNITLYNAFDNNDETTASTKLAGDSAIGSYIGYDYGKDVEVARVTGKIRMREYIIQYSDDKENWDDAVEGTSYSSAYGDNFENKINTNIGKHRYWRLYVKNGCSAYNWGVYVYSLRFYINDGSEKTYVGQVPYLNENTKEIINNRFNEMVESQWGNATLYGAFSYVNSNELYSCAIETGNNAVGSYIGYDFGTAVKVSRVVGKIRMREYLIQYSDDKENWNVAVNGTSYESAYGDKIDDVIDENIGKHRYWILYVKSGCSASNWASIVYSLQFYGNK